MVSAQEESIGAQLRAQRLRLRLRMSQSRTAGLLGTSQPNLSAYECGALAPGGLVRSRIRAFLDLDEDTVFAYTPTGTIPGYAAQLRTSLRKGFKDQIQLLVQLSDDFKSLRSPADQASFLTEPSTVGQQQWDAGQQG